MFNDYNSRVKIPQIHGCLAKERGEWCRELDGDNEVSKVKRLKLKDGDGMRCLSFLTRWHQIIFFFSYAPFGREVNVARHNVGGCS